jgi:hypothetical protein
MRHQDITATSRLLHDLAAVGRMQAERPSAAERVEALIGSELTGILRTTLVGTTPAGGLRHHRAA